MTEAIRNALDEALREADKHLDVHHEHPWHAVGEDGFQLDRGCAAYWEGLACCLDPRHGAYNRMLDYLTERIARALTEKAR